nr:RDD family protein [Halalkalibacter oceani]
MRHRAVQRKQEQEFVTQPEAAERPFYLAGFWLRLWAFLLDLVTVYAINGLLLSPLWRFAGGGEITIASFSGQTVLTALLFFLYFAIMTKVAGQTVGKMVFGLRVVSANGQPLTWGQILFREGVGRLLHHIFFLLQVLYVTVAFTARKQGLHDMIADTFVIQEKEPEQMVYQPVEVK